MAEESTPPGPPTGPPPGYGQAPPDQPGYGEPAYGQPPQNGQPAYGQPQPGQFGQPGYGQPQYGQPQPGQYGQPQYGQPQYGQPQYGQPGFPGQPWDGAPPKKRRTGLIIGLSVLGVIVVLVAIGGIVEATRSHKHLHFSAAAGLTPSTNQTIINELKQDESAQGSKGFQIEPFQRADGGVVLLGGGNLSAFDNPDSDLQKIADGFTKGVTTASSTATVTPYAPAAAGPRGGRVKCAELEIPGAPTGSSVCVYSDSDTAGIIFSVGQDPTATAALLSDYRVAEES